MSSYRSLLVPFVMASFVFIACASDPGDAPADESGADLSAGVAVPAAGVRLTTTTSLNLRRGPSNTAAVIRIMSPGDEVISKGGTLSNGYLSVTNHGTSGYAYLTYLKVEPGQGTVDAGTTARSDGGVSQPGLNGCFAVQTACGGSTSADPARACCPGSRCDTVGALLQKTCCVDVGVGCNEHADCCGQSQCVADATGAKTCQANSAGTVSQPGLNGCLATQAACGSDATDPSQQCCPGSRCDTVGGLLQKTCCVDVGVGCNEHADCCGQSKCVADATGAKTCQ